MLDRMLNVEKGFNSDISFQGISYHIQTEDWGTGNPFLVSRVFRNGAVLKSIKTSYSEVLPNGESSTSQAIRLAMRVQHESILDLLANGQLV